MRNSSAMRTDIPIKWAIWVAVAGTASLLVAANWHLVYVAIASQPDCVMHVRHSIGNAERGQFAAAQSSCAPLERGTP